MTGTRAVGSGIALVAAWLLGAGGCGDDSARETGSGTGITASGTGTDSGGTGIGDGSSTGEPECLLDLDCEMGACLDGMCCDAGNVCGDSCCGAGELCLFDQCKVPGDSCTTPDDCGEGQYCELAFGDPGGGMGTPPLPGLVCTEDLPPSGACIDLPEKCGDPGADPNDCVEPCEFQPETGQLDTAIKWQWGLTDAKDFPTFKDVWATPTVARLYDANCDGQVDTNDPPNVVFVSGETTETCCSCATPSTCTTGVLRMLDGSSGEEIWSLDAAQMGGPGFAGMSVALGDIDHDGYVDVVAMTGDGYPVMIDRNGQVQWIADQPTADASNGSFGWGGGLAVADMDGDGAVEIAYGRSLFTTSGGTITKLWEGAGGRGGGANQGLSFMVELDGVPPLELLAGNTAYAFDGSIVWQRAGLADGFTAVGDLDKSGTPEVVLVDAQVHVLDGATGADVLPAAGIPGDYFGGPPTVADFDGDGAPEVGVAGGQAYVVYEPDFGTNALTTAWTHTTKDTSSARTGSSVFDFEGDGRAEVVYSDECFLRVLDGVTGELRFAAPNPTFTATEALIVADVDGDAHAEIVRVSNSANWDCNTSPWTDGDPNTGLPPWTPPMGQGYYQGITVFGDAQNSWVGTRTVWNQHAYFVSNVCDGRDDACSPGAAYGEIPTTLKDNWTLPWLNNFRQNVQNQGIFDAADATVSLTVDCSEPVIVHVSVRNEGFAPLPAGVEIDVHKFDDDTLLGTVTTTKMLLPGQTETLDLTIDTNMATSADEFIGRIVTGAMQTWVECREDNNESDEAHAFCGPG